jgi:predicted  nucleic acid-binding Zn-ribbon protein
MIAQQLATLAEAMRNVQSQIGEMKGEARSERSEAQGARARLYSRMDDMGRQHAKMQSELQGVKEDIGELQKGVSSVREVTDKVTRWQLMGIGVVATVGAISALVGGLVAGFWHRILLGLNWA